MLKKLTRPLALFLAVFLLAALLPTASAYAAGGVLAVTEQPTDDPDEIRIVKESDGKTITDAEAIFRVEFFTNTNCSGSPARTWFYKTIDGYTLLNDRTYYLASCAGGTSDALYEGAAGLPTLPLGSIRVTEEQAPEGYLKSDFRLEGRITQPSTGADAVFAWTSQADNVIRYEADAAYIHNEPIRGNLKIIKRDKYEDIPLAGAGFRILDAEGQTVTEGTTNEQGEVTFPDLLYGEYQYQEIKAPKGYKLDGNIYPFSITENGVTVTKEAEDLRRSGTLQVKKQDVDGSALGGAVFLLEYSTDKGGSWASVFSREAGDDHVTPGGCTSPGLDNGQLTCGEDGTVTFTGLRADGSILYRLTETVAPEGFSLLGGSLYAGTLPVETDNTRAEDSEVFDGKTLCYTLYVTATDSSVFRLPETGGRGFVLLPFALVLAAAPIIFMKRKKEEHE